MGTTEKETSLAKEYSIYTYIVSTYTSGLPDVQKRYEGMSFEDRLKEATAQNEAGWRATISPLTEENVAREKGFANMFSRLGLSNDENRALQNTVYIVSGTVSANAPDDINLQRSFLQHKPYLEKLDEVEKGVDKEAQTLTLDNITYKIDKNKAYYHIKDELAEQFPEKRDKGKVYQVNKMFEDPKIATLEHGQLKLVPSTSYDKGVEGPSTAFLAEFKRVQQFNNPGSVPLEPLPPKPLEVNIDFPAWVKDVFKDIKGGEKTNTSEIKERAGSYNTSPEQIDSKKNFRE
jgi:hypothetical protein